MGHATHLPQDRRHPDDKEADAKHAAAQLGHATEEVTNRHYIVKPALAPDSSEILEQLGAGQATTRYERRSMAHARPDRHTGDRPRHAAARTRQGPIAPNVTEGFSGGDSKLHR